MMEFVSLIRFARACTPKVARVISKNPQVEKSVAEVAKMATCARGSNFGDCLAELSSAGKWMVGDKGVITLSARPSKQYTDVTIVTATFKKGKDVVAKIADFVSPKGNKFGGKVEGSQIRFADKVETNAEKVRQLAQKLGVDTKTVQERITSAKFSGRNIKDEKVLKDAIEGKFVTKPGKYKKDTPLAFKPAVFRELPMDTYFDLGYKRLGGTGEGLLDVAMKDRAILQKLGMQMPVDMNPMQTQIPLHQLCN